MSWDYIMWSILESILWDKEDKYDYPTTEVETKAHRTHDLLNIWHVGRKKIDTKTFQFLFRCPSVCSLYLLTLNNGARDSHKDSPKWPCAHTLKLGMDSTLSWLSEAPMLCPRACLVFTCIWLTWRWHEFATWDSWCLPSLSCPWPPIRTHMW